MGRGIEEDVYEDEMEYDDGSGGPTKPPRKQVSVRLWRRIHCRTKGRRTKNKIFVGFSRVL